MGRRAIFLISITALGAVAVVLVALRRGEPTRVSAAHMPDEPMDKSEDRESGYSVPNPRMQFRAVILVAALIVVAVAAVVVAVRPADEGPPDAPALADGPAATATMTASASGGVETAGGEATPEAKPAEPALGVDFNRLRVPSLGIDAPIVTLGVDATGTMQAPGNPTDVAWYNFSARPGEHGNVVMAGHLDYVNYGPAVFYRLKEARMGDEVELVLVDGSIARYRVTGVTSYDEATAPVLDIVGPTEVETVTLITCGGSFDTLSREYDKRVVLRAERIDEVAIGR